MGNEAGWNYSQWFAFLNPLTFGSTCYFQQSTRFGVYVPIPIITLPYKKYNTMP
jgi:hypothetical protein